MGNWVHWLREIDEEACTAICGECGPVSIEAKKVRRKGGEGILWVCSVARDKHRGVGTHGLTRAEAKAFKEDKVCEVCGTSENLKVDHCHKTGKLRGVLCDFHNKALGMFDDNVEDLLAAAAYLTRHQASEGPTLTADHPTARLPV